MTDEVAAGKLEALDGADADLVALLSDAGLPVSDLLGPGKQFHGFRQADGCLIAAGGLEVSGESALLRRCRKPAG